MVGLEPVDMRAYPGVEVQNSIPGLEDKMLVTSDYEPIAAVEVVMVDGEVYRHGDHGWTNCRVAIVGEKQLLAIIESDVVDPKQFE